MKQRAGLTLFGLLGADHHFGDEVDDSTSRLLGVVLGEKVTHVPRAAPTLPRYEAKDPARTQTHTREKQNAFQLVCLFNIRKIRLFNIR